MTCVAKTPWPVWGGGGKMWVEREEMGELDANVSTGGDDGGSCGEEGDAGRFSGVESRSCEMRSMGEVGFWYT